MSSEKIVEFVPLLNHKDYEILNEYPFTIRRKEDNINATEINDPRGYAIVILNTKTYYKHRLIAQQFLPNDDPEHKEYIDHINRDKTDYHLSNLRWVSASENSRNKTSYNGFIYTYIDKLTDNSLVVNDYGKHQFIDYYYDETTDKFYFYNGVKYRELHITEAENGSKYVNMIDTNDKRVRIYYSKFKKLYDLN